MMPGIGGGLRPYKSWRCGPVININDFESSLANSTWPLVQIFLDFPVVPSEQTMEYALAGHCASLDPGHVVLVDNWSSIIHCFNKMSNPGVTGLNS